MKLTSMQFDGDGGYDTPMNAGATAAAAEPAAPIAPVAESASETNMRNNAKAETATRMAGMGSPSALASQESGAIGSTSIATRMKAMGVSDYGSPAKTVYSPGADLGSSAKKAKAPKAIDKSNWDSKIKVSQSTIDAVKAAGRGNMGKAPQRTVKNDAIGLSSKGYVGSQMQYNAPVSAEYKEAVKRVYPNEVKSKPSPTFNQSSPNAKPYPKVAAPKSSKATIRKAENAEIDAANKKAPLQDRVAASITNSIKAYPSLVGLSGTTPKNYQIQGTQTKTQKAQAAVKADRAKAVAKAADKKSK
jgi:hypothetical protein